MLGQGSVLPPKTGRFLIGLTTYARARRRQPSWWREVAVVIAPGLFALAVFAAAVLAGIAS